MRALNNLTLQWADTVRSEPAFAWSAPLHFVDAEGNIHTPDYLGHQNTYRDLISDSPLQGQCSVVESRDCGDNDCVRKFISSLNTPNRGNYGIF